MFAEVSASAALAVCKFSSITFSTPSKSVFARLKKQSTPAFCAVEICSGRSVVVMELLEA